MAEDANSETSDLARMLADQTEGTATTPSMEDRRKMRWESMLWEAKIDEILGFVFYNEKYTEDAERTNWQKGRTSR